MNENYKIYLVFGLAGAGKTTIINSLISKRSDLVRLSGGSLISKEIPEASRDALRKVGEDEILKNQEILIINFQEAIKNLSDKIIIFDGHCLVKNENKIVEIPVSVIRRLSPTAIVFLNPKPQTIHAQRLADTNRPDREIEDIAALSAGRDHQISLCKKYALDLHIPLFIVDEPTTEKLGNILK